jgi:type VI protein secretion system component Hcp
MNHLVKAVFLMLAGAALNAMPASASASDIVLCVDGIQGESAIEDPRDCIDVTSWSWGMERPTILSGSTRQRGSVDVGDLVVVKEADRASAALLQGMLQGQNFKTASLIVFSCPAGCKANPVPLVTITLDNVILTRLDMGGMTGTRPTENLSLGFESVEYCYQEIAPDGSAGNEFCTQYSIQTAE